MKKLVIFNVYFAPNSFGGATIVCEELCRILSSKGWEILVITTNNFCFPYTKVRYQIDNINIISIGVPKNLDYIETYDNYKFTKVIGEILDYYHADAAHVHSIQTMGAGLINELLERNVPTILTLHDCWWFCERQFMINNNAKYCGNENCNESCLYCVEDYKRTQTRTKFLKKICTKVDRLLYPSNFFRELHLKWGFPEKTSFVNKNGIHWPQKNFQKTPSQHIRFGYVGGPGPIKGADTLYNAFKKLKNKNYELIVVDAAQNLGLEWTTFKSWDIPGKLTIYPAYQQKKMDDFFREIDVLLFPSLWKESFGLTVREALCRDKWVISTNAGGVIEDLIDGENCSLIPMTSNPQPLISAIRYAIENKNMIQAYRNPHKNQLRTFEDQAEELNLHLLDIIKNSK